MEMERNVINNKNFTKFYLRNKIKWGNNFKIYHFRVESKPHGRIDLLITASMKIYRTKKEKKSIPIVMKTCFSEEKLIKQFGNPLPKRTPYFWTTFLWPPSLSKF